MGRQRFGDSSRLANHLAVVREIGYDDLTAMAADVRTAARDSSLVAVLGRLDPASLRMLADSHPRGRSSPAFALLLDVDTWQDPDGDAEHPEVEAAAGVLRNAGWRVSVVRRGETTAQAWEILLAGYFARSAAAVLR
jgi:hypothetical protein